MDELTLFGKPMTECTQYDGRRSWCMLLVTVMVDVVEQANGWFSWVVDFNGPEITGGQFQTRELARDDAEATLRALHDALGEIVEPWRRDGHPTQSGEYQVVARKGGFRYSEITTCEWCGAWNLEGWAPNTVILAWRPMPTIPWSEGDEKCET
jgi:hypothetical protein